MSAVEYSRENETKECTFKDNIVIGKQLKQEKNVIIGQTILDSFSEHPNFIGMIDAVTEEKVTFAEMKDRSIRCALWLRKQGIGEDDIVVASTPIQMNDYVPYLATIYNNSIFNPWHYNASEEYVQHFFDTCQPKVIFASKESIDKLAKIAKSKRINCKFVTYEKYLKHYSSLEEIMAKQSQEECDNFKCAVGPLDPRKKKSIIMFSSGTTGMPKAIILPYQAHMEVTRDIQQSDMICLWYSTLAWITAIIHISSAIRMRCTRIIHKDFDSEITAKFTEKYKIDFMWFQPYLLTLWQQANIFKRYDFSHVKFMNYGGTKFNKATLEVCRKSLPHVTMNNGYGTTEAGGYLSIQTKNCKYIDSIGFPSEGVQMKVIDSNTGRKLGPNQKGELYFKKDTAMLGYLGNPEATKEVIDEDGWLRSGDIGFYDENGEIMLCDRMKALIKTKFITMSSYEFEECLIQHPDVHDCAVIGVEHPIDIERPFVFVVKADNTSVTAEQLLEFAANKNEHYGSTSGLVFVDQIPYNQSGKKCLRKLREMARVHMKQ